MKLNEKNKNKKPRGLSSASTFIPAVLAAIFPINHTPWTICATPGHQSYIYNCKTTSSRQGLSVTA